MILFIKLNDIIAKKFVYFIFKKLLLFKNCVLIFCNLQDLQRMLSDLVKVDYDIV